MTATAASANPKQRRKRLSEASMKAALKALADAGMQVQRVVVRGGEAEIVCGPVEHDPDTRNDGGLKEWT
jgi:hypothetical protein